MKYAPGMSKPGAGAERRPIAWKGKPPRVLRVPKPEDGTRTRLRYLKPDGVSISINQSIKRFRMHTATPDEGMEEEREDGKSAEIRPPYLLGANQETEEAINDVRCRI